MSTAPLTPERLAELERLEKAATPGPWRREMLALGNGGVMTLGIGTEVRPVCIMSGIVESPVGLRDVAFVTAARNDFVTLLQVARAHARLTSAMAHIHALGRGAAGSDIMTPERVEAWATERGWLDHFRKAE